MRKIVLTYGVISGLIVCLLFLVTFLFVNPNSDHGTYAEFLGYASMIISLSMVFFAVKSYRDNQSDGSITFGRGFLVGLYVTLIASVFFMVGWKIYSSIAMPNWMDDYARHAIDALRKSGASEAAILKKSKEMADMKEMMSNPLIAFLEPLMEILPVGIVMSLISALIFRRKSNITPAS